MAALALLGVAPARGADPNPSATPAPAQSAPADGLPHDAPHLEALLPHEFDGRPLSVLSVGRPTLEVIGGEGLGSLAWMADELGVDILSVEFAAANDPTRFVAGDEPSYDEVFNVFAMRAPGAAPERLESLYSEGSLRSEIDSSVEVTQLAGRPVRHLHAPHNPIPNVWFYAVGDVLLGVQAADPSLAERLIVLLPPGPALP